MPRQRPALHDQVRDVLLRDWDPIGVCDIPGAADEYDSYIPEICALMRSGSDAQALAAHLLELATGMACRPDLQRAAQAAEALLRLRAAAP